MAGFDFVTACENIVAAWDYVTPQLLRNASTELDSSAVSQQHQSQNLKKCLGQHLADP